MEEDKERFCGTGAWLGVADVQSSVVGSFKIQGHDYGLINAELANLAEIVLLLSWQYIWTVDPRSGQIRSLIGLIDLCCLQDGLAWANQQPDVST